MADEHSSLMAGEECVRKQDRREPSDAELIDAAYAKAYDAMPLDEPDAWGDLDAFHLAVATDCR